MPVRRLLAWFNPEVGEDSEHGRAGRAKATADGALGLPSADLLAELAATGGTRDPLGAGLRAEVVATGGGGADNSGTGSRLARLLGLPDSNTLLRAALGGPDPGPPK